MVFRTRRMHSARFFKMLFLWTALSFLVISVKTANAASEWLWLKLDESPQGAIKSEQRFVLSFGQLPSAFEDIGTLPKIEVFSANGARDQQHNLLFRNHEVAYKDGKGYFTINSDDSKWCFVFARAMKSDGGSHYVYSARADVIFNQVGPGDSGTLKYQDNPQTQPDFNFMVFYKRNREDFGFINMNWSSLIGVVDFNGSRFQNKNVVIYNPNGEQWQGKINKSGRFSYKPWKDNGHPAQNFMAVSEELSGKIYKGTYTVLLEHRRLPWHGRHGNSVLGLGLFILTMVGTFVLLSVYKRPYAN